MSSKTKGKEEVKADATQPAQNPTVEELAQQLGLKPWQFAGLLRAQGWAPGKRVSQKEFQARLAAWLNSPMAR